MLKPFIPNSATLEAMIRNAMTKADADIEQARLAEAARAERRAVRAMTNEAKAVAQKKRWGF